MNHELLDERILVLHQIIESTSKFYFNSGLNEGQTGLYDTIIGAALWHLPSGTELFSGKISESALESLENNPLTTKLVEEHSFPRKIGGKYLYELHRALGKLTKDDIIEVYKEKLGKFNLVLKEENDALKKYQKLENIPYEEGGFLNSVSDIELYAYRKANIQLLDFSLERYKEFKKMQSKINNSKRLGSKIPMLLD